ncbi:MAG: hypothetical protein HY928_15885 [Elusimicrobia bacterium]|nr:hypothetical protein [Elusimicrobiota bacterium]
MSDRARRLVWVLSAAAALVCAVYADLWLRARTACLTGDRYMAWNSDSAAKKAWFDARLSAEKSALDEDLAAGRMDKAEHAERAALAEFRRDEAVAESSLKYAYHWYKTAVELFSPPETKYVRLSRQRMAEAKRLWKLELDAAKIPYEDYMLQ